MNGTDTVMRIFIKYLSLEVDGYGNITIADPNEGQAITIDDQAVEAIAKAMTESRKFASHIRALEGKEYPRHG